jgi:hypothetical protein
MSSLENVKVGDKVIYGSYRGGERVCVVTKVTKLHFCIDDGDSKYRKSRGTMVGGSGWSGYRVRAPKDEADLQRVMDEQAAANARSFVKDYIDSIRNTPAAFVPIAKFIKENMKCSDATS